MDIRDIRNGQRVWVNSGNMPPFEAQVMRKFGNKAVKVQYLGTSNTQDFSSGRVTTVDCVKSASFCPSKLFVNLEDIPV